MCEMRVVINKVMLGQRELGWELWSGKDVMELTSVQIKSLIKKGEKVCGLVIGKDGELVLDKEGFFTTNMCLHSHVGNWKPMVEGSMANLLYVCVGSHEENEVVSYDCISSRFERAKFTEADMKAFLKIGIVSGGAKLDGERIVLASLKYDKPEEKATGLEEKKVPEVKEESKMEEKKPDTEEPKPDAEVKKPEVKEEKAIVPDKEVSNNFFGKRR